jgi:hypothetical protein
MRKGQYIMSQYEITCANKNPNGMITRVGGEGWSFEIREAIIKILSQQDQLTIRVDGRLAQIGVRGEGFDSYLAIEPDGYAIHLLSDLPSC